MTGRAGALLLAACVAAGVVACTTDPLPASSQEGRPMQLTSTAFTDEGAIPAIHTCDGEDRSPPLAWSDVPDGVSAFALVATDPDARDFVHWILTDIPGDARELPVGEGDAIGAPAANDFGRTGWGGPCPPSGTHRYVFTLWALPEPLEPDASSAETVREAAERDALASATLTGTYQRQR